MKKFPTDKELEAEVQYFIEHQDEIAARQHAEREAYRNDPANAERLAVVRERMKIAEILYQARAAAKLTQAEVAERMKVSQPLIARLERGRGNISLETIAKYAAACGKRIALTLL